MDGNTADQLSYEFECALSAIIPGITQVIQQYRVSGVLKMNLVIRLAGEGRLAGAGCTYIGGKPTCTGLPPVLLEIVPEEALNFHETSEAPPELVQQFYTDIASTLSTIMAFLEQSIQRIGKSFEVRFFIDTATLNSEQPIVSQWVSNTSQVNILQCSQP
jgi:hypothetical protein